MLLLIFFLVHDIKIISTLPCDVIDCFLLVNYVQAQSEVLITHNSLYVLFLLLRCNVLN